MKTTKHAQPALKRTRENKLTNPDGMAPASHPTGGCILLVDDDPSVRESLRELLTGEGYTVVPAENGDQALELVNQSPIDLVLLDLNMPSKNGWDTFEALTNGHPFIPVIIVTARPNQYFMALNAGAGALMEKPMDIPALLQTMEKLLAESAERRLQRLVGQNPEFHFKPASAS